MKRLVIMAVVLIGFMLSFPFHFSANESEATNTKEVDSESQEQGDAYNELGIKKGTKVNGEDISELSEEELQYIPEGWRDGHVEDEPNDEPGNRAYIRAVYPNVNDYIFSNKLPTAQVEYDYKSVLPKIGYRFGKPEGIVAHETANDTSTITGEISYMTRNYQNAFVHAFVDHSRAIEVHPTNFIAWGAGRHANERFIHVELVRVHSFDEFARSINNYATYIASLLYTYDLGVVDAETTGKGTLWSHLAVSNHLGGTNHSDPHGYFARWGYNWESFVELVKIKYDGLHAIKTHSTSKLGHINSSKSRIYDDLSNLQNYEIAGTGTEYMSQVYYIKLQAVVDGDVYYLLSLKPSSETGTVGWIKAKDMKVYAHTGVDKNKKSFKIVGTGKAYDKAWGSKKNVVYNDLSPLAGATFHVNLTEKVGNNIWYRGKLDGEQVWIHSSYLNGFADVPDNASHHDAIYALVEMGAINGYPDNTFRPGEEISRSQTAAIFTKALDLPIPTNKEEVLKNYSDVNESSYYAEQIAATYQAGIFSGSDGAFMDGPLTREQMATVIVEAFDLKNTGIYTGIRLDNVSASHKRNVSILAQHGVTNQLIDFRPGETVTRGQFATFVYEAMQE